MSRTPMRPVAAVSGQTCSRLWRWNEGVADVEFNRLDVPLEEYAALMTLASIGAYTRISGVLIHF